MHKNDKSISLIILLNRKKNNVTIKQKEKGIH